MNGHLFSVFKSGDPKRARYGCALSPRPVVLREVLPLGRPQRYRTT